MTGSARTVALVLTAVCLAGAAKAPKAPAPPPAAKPTAPKILPPQEYAFRGMLLGTTLADFRKAAFPDAGKTASVICSSDPGVDKMNGVTGLDLMLPQRNAGAIVCAYFSKDPAKPDSWLAASVSLGTNGGASTDLIYNFVPDPADQVSKLYLVRATADAALVKQIVASTTADYGQPSSNREQQVEPPMGAPYTQVEVIWRNPLSELSIRAPFYGKDRLGIFYTENRLSDVVAMAKPPATPGK